MNDTKFKKGHIPWNKGIKTGLKPINGFKKGNITWHTRVIGSERLDKDGYIMIKIANHKWVKKHRWIWEEKNGKIPKGSVIIFADGNKENLNLDNLICVTRNELKILNQCRLISSIPELTKTGLNIVKIKAKLYELRKESKK